MTRSTFRPVVGAVLAVACALTLTVTSLHYGGQLSAAPKVSTPVTDANITGHVVDAETGKHISGATIIIQETNLSVKTDASGHYTLRNLRPGRITLTLLAEGYLTQSKVVEAKRGVTLEVQFEAVQDNTQLEEVVVTANRQRMLRRYAPTLVSVIDDKSFRMNNAVNLAGGLTFKPGIRVENDCQNCGFNQVRINGLDGHYSQILLDSRPIYSALAGVYGLEQIPANMIDRVEVVRGGGSALYGSSAIAGVINVITKEPSTNSFLFSENLSLTGGIKPDNTISFNGTLLSPDGHIGAMIFGQHRNRKAWDADKDGFSEIGQIEARSLGTKTFFHLSPQSRLSAEFHSTQEKRRGGDNLDIPEHVASVAESVSHSIQSGNARYTYRSEDLNHNLELYVSGQHILRNSYYGGIGDAAVGSLGSPTSHDAYGDNYGRTIGDVWMGGGQYTYSFDNLLFMPASILVGTEYLYDRLQDKMPILYNHTTTPRGSESLFPAMDQCIQNYSQMAQIEWKNNSFTLLLGGRVDENSAVKGKNAKGFAPIFTPRATVRYNPLSWINLRASYAQGFRAPQTFDEDLHVRVVNGEAQKVTNNENLKPEYSHSVSVSNDMYFSHGKMQANLLIEGFFTKLKGAFNNEPLGSKDGFRLYERVNGADASIYGANIEGKIAWRRLSIQAGFTFTHNRWDKPQATGAERSLLVGETEDAPKEIDTKTDHGPSTLAGFQTDDEGKYVNIDIMSDRFLKTPTTYGYLTLSYNPIKALNLTATCNYTGSMLVPHVIEVGRGAAMIDRELINEGRRPDTSKEDEAPAWGVLEQTPSFFDLGLRASYDFDLYTSSTLQLYVGVNNLLNAFQRDFDIKGYRDSGYIYGPTQPRTLYMGFSLRI